MQKSACISKMEASFAMVERTTENFKFRPDNIVLKNKAIRYIPNQVEVYNSIVIKGD